jgi:glycosyltransferase involved in cell wall biosynthesis
MGNFRCFDCWNCVHPLDLHVVYHYFSIIRGFEIIVTQPRLSIIIPAYNEENRLPNTLEQVFNFIQKQKYLTEVLIVENGSSDRTFEVAQDFANSNPHCFAFQMVDRGKGLAVREGMLRAVGQYRFMCDADLSMPIAEINRFLPPSLEDFDIAIASREAPGSVRYGEPGYRHWGGRGINLIIRLLALPGLRDTQCGFKCFRAEIAKDIFGFQTFAGISFDPEVLYIARLRGYRIVELPIPWYYSDESRIHLFKDTLALIQDLFTIRRNARIGRYDPKPIA